MAEPAESDWDHLRVPQTNVQLYRLLRDLGYGPSDLERVRRAYELGARAYSGRYQGDGKPMIAHGIGTAGVLAHLAASPELVASALIHNVYTNGDLGVLYPEERGRARRLVQRAVGSDVESYVDRFRTMRPGKFQASVDDLDDLDRDVLILHSAEMLEKMYECGIAYWDVDLDAFLAAAETRADLIEQVVPQLAAWIRQASAAVRREPPAPGLRYRSGSSVTLPPSATIRLRSVVKTEVWSAYRRLRAYAARLARRVMRRKHEWRSTEYR